MSRIVDLVAAQPWAMTEIYLRGILELAAREPGPAIEQLRAEHRQRLEALQGKGGTPLRGTANVTLRGTTAIVPVAGPLFRYANLFTDMSGATSLEQLAADFTAAVDSPQVTRVLLALDSPGGQVNGIAEFATLVRDAQARKPVIAYVSDAARAAPTGSPRPPAKSTSRRPRCWARSAS
jgi:ClpP class serine protease